MNWQETSYWCGPASMEAASRVLQRPVSQQVFAKLAGTTDEDGTSEEDVKRGLLAKRFEIDEITENTPNLARIRLLVSLRLGYPVILCVQRHTHWVCAIGNIGNRFIVFDPARYEYRIDSGVTVYEWKKLQRIWYASKRTRGAGAAYYGVAVYD